ncbi:MAG: hypothetical protein H7836_11285 [Magnetococcus sp. YQC-3]
MTTTEEKLISIYSYCDKNGLSSQQLYSLQKTHPEFPAHKKHRVVKTKKGDTRDEYFYSETELEAFVHKHVARPKFDNTLAQTFMRPKLKTRQPHKVKVYT